MTAELHLETLRLLFSPGEQPAFLTVSLFVVRPGLIITPRMFVGVFFLSPRSRQLELEDKQSTLELELRKYMDANGVYWCAHTHTHTQARLFPGRAF